MLILLLTAAFVAGCGGGEPTEQVATTNDGNNRSTQSEDVVFMVRLLAKGDVRQYWFLDLASIRSDSGLAPLSQNLTDTWNGWNQDSSDEFGVTLQDADFAVSLPSNAVFLGGIEDIEGAAGNRRCPGLSAARNRRGGLLDQSRSRMGELHISPERRDHDNEPRPKLFLGRWCEQPD